MPTERKEYRIDIAEVTNPVDVLSSDTGFSKQKIKQFMQKGAVWLSDNKGTHRLRRKSKVLQPGSTLYLYYDNSILNAVVDDAILIADEGDYSFWYKPRGMLSQGSKWSDHCAINRWVEQHLEPQRPSFTVHRLDRFASGLMLIAHKKTTTTLLADLFKNKKIKKQYKVIVHGNFGEEKRTYTKNVDDKAAISHVSLLDYDKASNTSLVIVDIETGRKHQIRIHLSGAGFPVVGDRLYGDSDESEDLQLTAFKLSFPNPIDGEEKTYILNEALQPKLKN